MQTGRSHEILCLKKLGQCTAHASPDRAWYVKVETVDRCKGAYVSHVSLNILSYALRRALGGRSKSRPPHKAILVDHPSPPRLALLYSE